TVMLEVFAVARLPAGIVAINCVTLTNVVVRSRLSKRTVEPLTKPDPVTVIGRSGLPAPTEFGFTLVIDGDPLLIVKKTGLDVPPPGVGVKPVTGTDPGLPIAAVGTFAFSRVELTKVVVHWKPLKRTDEELTKLTPVTPRSNMGPPAVAEVGFTLVNCGAGLR